MSTKLFKNNNDNITFKMGTLLVHTGFGSGSHTVVPTTHNFIYWHLDWEIILPGRLSWSHTQVHIFSMSQALNRMCHSSNMVKALFSLSPELQYSWNHPRKEDGSTFHYSTHTNNWKLSFNMYCMFAPYGYVLMTSTRIAVLALHKRELFSSSQH